jgi:hypothetical protein
MYDAVKLTSARAGFGLSSSGGERRYRALKLLGRKEIKAIIKPDVKTRQEAVLQANRVKNIKCMLEDTFSVSCYLIINLQVCLIAAFLWV